VPTWTEQGVDCVIGTWRGVIGAAGITADAIAFWEGALQAATASAEWNAELVEKYWANTWLGGAALRDFLDRERGVMGGLLGELGLLPGVKA